MSGGWIPVWCRLALGGLIVRRACATAVVVGSFLTTINHIDDIAAGRLPASAPWQLALTFAVPYLVSTTASVAAIRAQRMAGRGFDAPERGIEAIHKFPDHNPNPVLRMSLDGRLLYANASSEPLQAALGVGVGGLVSDEIRDRLLATAGTRDGGVSGSPGPSAPGGPDTLEFEAGARTFAVLPVAVPELGVVNLYGTDVTARPGPPRARSF